MVVKVSKAASMRFDHVKQKRIKKYCKELKGIKLNKREVRGIKKKIE